MNVDGDLLRDWTRGWALTRGVAPPVAEDDGGWRIEVGWPDQIRRYVYAEANDAVRRRAEAVHTPGVFLKVCSGPARVRALLPDRWIVPPPGFLMTLTGLMTAKTAAPPDDYAVDLDLADAVVSCRLLGADGTEAARGRAVRVGDRAVYDRIVTAEGHRRRGLGTRVMLALEQAMRDRGAGDGALVATAEGRILYESLGWELHAPYVTAVIPGPAS
jgi:GNAT superfamily N-acetyltransferase